MATPPPQKKNYRQYTLIKQKGSIKTMDARQEFFKRGGGGQTFGESPKICEGARGPHNFFTKAPKCML